MTITYPRDLPEPFPWRPGCKFVPKYQQSRAPTRGGLQQVVDLGRDYWWMRYETVPLPEDRASAFEAWLSTLRGGTRLFKAYHPLRALPVAYPTGFAGLVKATGGSFTGVGALTAVGTSLDTMTVSGLPASFKISLGDMMSFAYGDSGQALHRAVEAVTASAGGVAVIPVEPNVAPGWAANAAVAFEKAWCKGVIEPESIDVSWQAGRYAVFSFTAAQSH